MTELIEDTATKIRRWPISSRLAQILLTAGQMVGVDTVRVTSGGQMRLSTAIAKGATKGSDKVWRLPNGKKVRIGSTRHDDGNAADLRLEINGSSQSFTTSSGQKLFADFAEKTAALGCTGLGAGVPYMGRYTMHVGFGSKAVWANRGQTAPGWLVSAVKRGWNAPIDINTLSPAPGIDLTGTGRYRVIGRPHLFLRAGDGTNFRKIGQIDFGTEVNVVGRKGDWATIDLLFDGTPDGFSHGAFLRKV